MSTSAIDFSSFHDKTMTRCRKSWQDWMRYSPRRTKGTEYLIERKVAIEQVCKIEKGKKKEPTIRNIRSLIRNWMEICYATNQIMELSASRGSFSNSTIDNLTHETATIFFWFSFGSKEYLWDTYSWEIETNKNCETTLLWPYMKRN